MVGVQKPKIRWAISLFLVLYFYALPAQAQYGGGTGEPNDPYMIYTTKQMNAIRANPNDWDKNFKLMADIDLSGFSYQRALISPDTDRKFRFQGTAFTGIFDGNGHKISGLTIRGEDYLGLFGYLSSGAVVKDLGIVNVNITGSNGYVGGLVGSNAGTVNHCYSAGVVSGTEYSVGGLVGGNEGLVNNCYSAGTVRGKNYVGGLVGHNSGDMIRCYSTGAVSGDRPVGGLVGRNYGDMISCYSTGAVSGNRSVGGLVGDNDGLVTHCYSTGTVSGSGYVGGLVGSGRDVTASFWDIETSGQQTSDGGTGLTTARMQDIRTYLDAGWDWIGEIENGTSEIWQMPEGGGYPVLAIFNGYTPPKLRGSGTPENPYLISNSMELGAMTYYSPYAHYRLADSIDLAGIRWGTAVIPCFGGTFDGNNLTISHMTIEGERYLGLFGRLESCAVVKDLGVVDVNITGSGECIGGLMGYNWSSSLIRCYSTGRISGYRSVGGLVGSNYKGRILNSYTSSTVNGTGGDVGGLVGKKSSWWNNHQLQFVGQNFRK